MTAVLACGLGLAIVGVGAPAWAADNDTAPTADPTVTATITPTETPTASPTTPAPDEVAPTATDTPTATPTASPTTTDTPAPVSVLPSGFPTDLIPTGLLPTDLPELLKSDLKLHGVCGPHGVIWTLTNVTTSKIGYAFIDTNLTWGLGVVPGGATVPLSAHGIAVLAIPLNAASGLPYKLPTIGFELCGSIGGSTPPTSATTGGATPATTATAATPILTSNVHFTG